MPAKDKLPPFPSRLPGSGVKQTPAAGRVTLVATAPKGAGGGRRGASSSGGGSSAARGPSLADASAQRLSRFKSSAAAHAKSAQAEVQASAKTVGTLKEVLREGLSCIKRASTLCDIITSEQGNSTALNQSFMLETSTVNQWAVECLGILRKDASDYTAEVEAERAASRAKILRLARGGAK